MRVKKLEISRVINDAAHEIAGLFIVKISDMHPLKFVVCACAQIPHQVPCRLMREVVT